VTILDTNVLSALMRSEPDQPVLRWLDLQAAQSVWITSITLFESRLGLALLPAGRRRVALEAAFDRLLEEDLENRVLPFDSTAALQAAVLAAARQEAGRPVDLRDTQIASIAQARRATLATRRVRHFEGLSVPVVNAWDRALPVRFRRTQRPSRTGGPSSIRRRPARLQQRLRLRLRLPTPWPFATQRLRRTRAPGGVMSRGVVPVFSRFGSRARCAPSFMSSPVRWPGAWLRP
jgi:toxin FitB